MPGRFREVHAVPLQDAGVRRVNVRRYAVLYRVDESAGVVYVIAMLYGMPSDERLGEILSGE